MRSKSLSIVVLVIAVCLDALVIFVFPDPLPRVIMGLLFLIPIVWAADSLGVAGWITDLPATRVRHRQYGALRSNVRLLLDVVRRMNWLAVDLARGIRSPEEVEDEMDEAYSLMQGIVLGIRKTAGRASADPEIIATPDLMLDKKSLSEAPAEVAPEMAASGDNDLEET